MNDELREKLSAYLDGALSEMDRKDIEERLARSEEMRLELEALRAVSASVKGLPKENLPAGFAARLEARRARGEKPERAYFILPPAYRPLAFALSSAVVALVIWDKNNPSKEYAEPHVGWEGDRIAVKSAAEAPPSVDVSGQLSAMKVGAKLSEDESAKKEDAGKADDANSTFGKHLSAPGKPFGIAESAGALAGGSGMIARQAAAVSPAAPAAASPAPPSEKEPLEDKNAPLIARNEEERSAINERLYKGFEEEKKRMGIARIMDKDSEGDRRASGQDVMALQASPEAPALDRVDRAPSKSASARGALRAKAERSAPTLQALALRSADALFTAWAAAGLPGKPPAVKFPGEMALFLAGPAGCGITDVQERKKLIVVLYKNAGFDDASARVRAVPLSSKPVVVKPVE